MTDDYQRRSYGEISVGTGEKPGIVVVDFQLGFTDPQYPLGGAPLVMRALENTARLHRAVDIKKPPTEHWPVSAEGLSQPVSRSAPPDLTAVLTMAPGEILPFGREYSTKPARGPQQTWPAFTKQ